MSKNNLHKNKQTNIKSTQYIKSKNKPRLIPILKIHKTQTKTRNKNTPKNTFPNPKKTKKFEFLFCTFSGFSRTRPAIIDERNVGWQRNIGGSHTELCPHHADLDTHLGQVPRRFDRRFQIRHRVPDQNGAVPNLRWQTRPSISQNSVRGRDQVLIVLKPHEDFP